MAFRLDSFAATLNSEEMVMKRAAFLAGTAIVISAATILFFNMLYELRLDLMSDGVQLMAVTMFPYLVSAVIAAITAIAVISMVPSARLSQPTETIRERLQAMATGDLASRVNAKPKSAIMQAMIADLNLATGTISHDIASWKMINRQQWELLETLREITVVSRQKEMVRVIEQMERNWEKIAEIEARLTT